jgi:F-type H+-transporting ATPase subunit b
MFGDPTFWVLIAFVILVGALYKKLASGLTAALDARAHSVRQQIEEAQRLREEAQAMLAQYQRQQRDAEATAKEMVEHAREQAEALLKQAEKDAEALAERHKTMAEARIAQMEAQAVAEVRAVAAEVAVQATRSLIEQQLDAGKATSLLQNSIEQLPGRLN